MYKFLKTLSIISIGLILLGTIAFAEDTRILKFGNHLQFGSVEIGDSVSRDLTLYNEGNATLHISKLRFHKRIETVYAGDWSGDIEPGESKSISITFTPLEANGVNVYNSGLVYVESDRTNTETEYSRSLKGEGIDINTTCTKILKFGSHLHFGDVTVGESTTKEITLYNKGTCPLTIEDFRFHDRLEGVFTGDFSGIIEANASQTATITFTPTEEKRYSGLVYVNSDRTNSGEYSRALIGTGIVDNNRPPIANAGGHQNVSESTEVHLDGSQSNDPDGDVITYAWNFILKPAGSTATLSDATIVNPTFVADTIGTYKIQLTVNDGIENSVVDTVTIVASVINDYELTVCDEWSVSKVGGAEGTQDRWDISSIPKGASFDFEFEAYSVPDKFRVEYNGTAELQTGWRGSYTPDNDPLEGPGRFNQYGLFVKDDSNTMSVIVTGAQLGTGWKYRVRCTQ